MTRPGSAPVLPERRGCFGAGGSCPALAMGRVAAVGALLVPLVVLGASSAAGAELSGEQEGREGKWWERWSVERKVGPSN